MPNKFDGLRLTPQVEALSESDKQRLAESFDDPTQCLQVMESLGLELKKECNTPSTDIDGTPILVLSAPEIEFLAELMDDASIGAANSFFGRPYEPNETGTYKRMRRFLDDHGVTAWLDESKDLVDAIICDDLEEVEKDA